VHASQRLTAERSSSARLAGIWQVARARRRPLARRLRPPRRPGRAQGPRRRRPRAQGRLWRGQAQGRQPDEWRGVSVLGEEQQALSAGRKVGLGREMGMPCRDDAEQSDPRAPSAPPRCHSTWRGCARRQVHLQAGARVGRASVGPATGQEPSAIGRARKNKEESAPAAPPAAADDDDGPRCTTRLGTTTTRRRRRPS